MLAEAEAATGHPDRAAAAAAVGLETLARTGQPVVAGTARAGRERRTHCSHLRARADMTIPRLLSRNRGIGRRSASDPDHARGLQPAAMAPR